MTQTHYDVYKIALSLVEQLNFKLVQQLISTVDNIVDLFDSSNFDTCFNKNEQTSILELLSSYKLMAQAENIFKINTEKKIGINFCADKGFYTKLANCADAPVLLYKLGSDIDFDNSFVISIVGTRKCDNLAKKFIDKFVSDLQRFNKNIVIVSGLANGVDTFAHQAALNCGFKTAAILGTGLDYIYPFKNTQLARQIVLSGGMLLTEYYYGYPMSKKNFPRRNRIIAGLCDAIVVVQSTLSGGAMLTAKLASSYNRDVFAVPGRPTDILSEGCNRLIRNNIAATISSAYDFAYYMGW